MKKVISLSLILLFFFSCKGNEESINYATFSGNIKNTNETVLKMSLYDFSYNKEIAIDEFGNFKDTINIKREGFYSFQVGRSYTSVFLRKGDDLSLSIDANDFHKSIKYNGKGEIVNNYYRERIKLKSKLVGDAKEFYVVPLNDFLEKIETNKNKFLEHLDQSKISDRDKEIHKKMIKYDYILTKFNYDKFNHYHTKEHPKLPAGYYDEVINMNLDDDEAFHFDRSYRILVIENWRLTSKIAEKTNPDFTKISFVKEKIKDIRSVSISEQITSMLLREVSSKNKDYEKAYNEILPLFKTKYNIDRLNQRYASAKSTQPEMKTMDFKYENFNGGTTSLNDLKGKILYIEIWATWCGPCVKESPYLSKLVKKYKRKNIEFVSISIDSRKDYEKWRAMVKELDVGGTQLIADNELKSDFMKFFSVGLIPRSILLDKEGKIITDKAPRPSNPDLIELLNSLDI